MVVDFRPSRRPTLGVEWELGLVDARTGDLVSAAAAVVEEARGGLPDGESRVHRELLRNTVELVTGICESVPQAVDDLRESRDVVRRVARQRGLEIFSAGTHPFARWYEQEVSEGERYATLIERTQWWGRHMLIFGVHVHVGVDSAGKVLPILNGLLRWFPHLQALSASSPFWGGADTGYASNRALMFQQLPTAGLPFQFDTWPQFEAYVGDMLATGVISEFKEIRWDIRPSPALGTIEIRICDGLPTLGEVAAVAALTHCLVVDLDRRLEAGEVPPTLPPWHVQENKWRAARYGLDAQVILDAQNHERLVTEDLNDLLSRLEPVAARLECSAGLASVSDLMAAGASYQRQRQVAARAGGDLWAVVDSLVREMREGLPGSAARTPNHAARHIGGADTP
jgi:glutamate---cysteine ligase / carboxylate-amine ligase